MSKNYLEEFKCGKYSYDGIVNDAYDFIVRKQISRTDLWEKFVLQFKTYSDSEKKGWRGEFWGKMMRGASLVCSYTRDDALYEILTDTVKDMMSAKDETGRISTYSIETEFNGWDMWCRKYVMLGMEYYLDICKDDELKKEIIASIRAQADYIISKIGDEEGKTPINETTNLWRGLNSSSILEPIIRLYQLTNDKKYLDFSTYIIKSGGTSIENIFALAYEDNLYPYQYPVTKAYEMISCFEGLLEYYLVTGIEECKETVIRFANKILESDFTVIGCSGCTEELFDHSSVRQANIDISETTQETCVTVTLMKFMARMHLLTGNVKYADAYERSFYNAYLGAFNTFDQIEYCVDYTNNKVEPMTFDSYSPLTKNTRGRQMGGRQIFSDGSYYGCCACIGSAGVGLYHKIQALKNDSSIVINLFEKGSIVLETPKGNPIGLNFDTNYPVEGKVKITLSMENDEKFELLIRNPEWSKNSKISSCNAEISEKDGYFHLTKLWKNQDEIELDFDMRTKVISAPEYGSQILMNKVIWDKNYVVPTFDSQDPEAKKRVALKRGPLMLAIDSQLGYNLDEKVGFDIKADGCIDVKPSDRDIPYPCVIKVDAPLKNGGYVTLTDYSSAGKIFKADQDMAVWIYNF